MEVALDYLFTFHNKNKVLIYRFHNMSAIVAAILDFSKIIIFAKLQQFYCN